MRGNESMTEYKEELPGSVTVRLADNGQAYAPGGTVVCANGATCKGWSRKAVEAAWRLQDRRKSDQAAGPLPEGWKVLEDGSGVENGHSVVGVEGSFVCWTTDDDHTAVRTPAVAAALRLAGWTVTAPDAKD